MAIQRHDVGPRMSKAVVHGDTIYLAGLTADKARGKSVTEQTREILSLIDGYIAFAPAGSEASFASIVAPGTGFVLADGSIDAPPGVEGFGRCLLQAARGLFDLGYGAIGLLNSDSPTMPAELMIEAAQLLMQPDDRVVLGPATDGGYYLIGLRAPHAGLFTAIDWSTERVAAQTRARAHACGLQVVELAPWYDVDDPASLKQLLRDVDGRPEAAPSTAGWLRRSGIAERLAKARAM